MKKAVLFDMFWTLVDPHNQFERLESDPVGMTTDAWNKAMWGPEIGEDRGLGVYQSPQELMDKIWEILPVETTEEQRAASYEGKCFRMYQALTDIDPQILNTLKTLKERGYKLGLISNADPLDTMFFKQSPLKEYFDDVIFSWEVKLLKPSREIYQLALDHLGVKAEEAFFVGDGGSQEHYGASQMGITTVWTEYLQQWDAATRKQIAKHADYHITQFEELLEITK